MVYDYDMSDDRLNLRTIQPSEPILAWAAYWQMATKPSCRLEVIKNFYKQCSLGSIDTGDIGQMAATPKPQTVLDFVQSLFGDRQTAKLSSEPAGKHVVHLMTKGYVFFNHFTRLEGPVTPTVLRQAWGRGTALFSYPGTDHFDIIIPIAVLEHNKMSFIAIQVKNRLGDQLTAGLKNEADFTISSAAQALPATDAYMGILMALRTDQNPQVSIAVESSKSNNQKKRTRSNDDRMQGNL